MFFGVRAERLYGCLRRQSVHLACGTAVVPIAARFFQLLPRLAVFPAVSSDDPASFAAPAD